MTDELELKYAVDDTAALEQWLDEEFPPAPGDAGWRTARVTDRYFDTYGRALEQAGYGARLRRTDGSVVVTLKSEVAEVAAGDGFHHRIELEAEAVDSLRPARWPRSEVRDLIERTGGKRRLVERFVLRQRRRERTHRLAEGGACMLSVDLVTVVARGERLAELRQLEVELVEGDKSVLRAMARRIEGSGLATPEARSKMALAAGIVEGRGPIGTGELFAEAGRRVLLGHLRRMRDREKRARAGDTLAIKQMRVATRRMRSVWRVFDGAYRRADQRRHLRQLRQVARRLGAVRDLDVLLEALPADPLLEPLAADWRARRRQAFRQLLRSLDGNRYRRFLGDYLAFARTPGEGVARGSAGVLVRDVAGSRIQLAYEHVRSHEAALAEGDPGALHALRIDAKRLRYTLETFREILPEPIVADLIARLTRVQDVLGEFNDARVAAAAVSEWLAGAGTSAPAESVEAARAYASDRQAAAERAAASFRPAWRGVAGATFRRQLARAIAAI